MWSKGIRKQFFVQLLSMLTGVQAINNIPVDVKHTTTIKALNTKETLLVKMHFSHLKAAFSAGSSLQYRYNSDIGH